MVYKITAFIYKHQNFSLLHDIKNLERYLWTSRGTFMAFKSAENAEQHFKELQFGENELIEILMDWGEEDYCKSMRIAITDQNDQIIKVLAEVGFQSTIFI